MAVEKETVGDVTFRPAWPWVRLFDAFWVALDPFKMLLAAAGVVVMYLGLAALAYLFDPGDYNPAKEDFPAVNVAQERPEVTDPEERAKLQREENLKAERQFREAQANTDFRRALADHYLTWPANLPRGGNENPVQLVSANASRLTAWDYWRAQAPALVEPLYNFLRPVLLLLGMRLDLPGTPGIGSKFFALLALVWIIFTWGIFGGALTRMAAVQVARKEKVGPIVALAFATQRWLAYCVAPLGPLVVIAAITVVMALVGGILLALRLDVVAALLWFLPLLGGAAMAFLLIGYVGWPLMFATISAEGADSFTAVFSSYSYICQRPWQYLGYALLSLLYGVAVTFFVVFAVSLAAYLARFGVEQSYVLTQFAFRDTDVDVMFVYAPQSYGWRDLLTEGQAKTLLAGGLTTYQKAVAGVMAAWLHLLFLVMIGFAYSYFWCASTTIYFLLRQSVDGNDLDEVYLEDEEEALPPVPSAAPSARAAEPPPPATSLPVIAAPPPAAAPAPPPAALAPPAASLPELPPLPSVAEIKSPPEARPSLPEPKALEPEPKAAEPKPDGEPRVTDKTEPESAAGPGVK
jgi:hypothetical protein